MNRGVVAARTIGADISPQANSARAGGALGAGQAGRQSLPNPNFDVRTNPGPARCPRPAPHPVLV